MAGDRGAWGLLASGEAIAAEASTGASIPQEVPEPRGVKVAGVSSSNSMPSGVSSRTHSSSESSSSGSRVSSSGPEGRKSARTVRT
jgi:hypothetical protein